MSRESFIAANRLVTGRTLAILPDKLSELLARLESEPSDEEKPARRAKPLAAVPSVSPRATSGRIGVLGLSGYLGYHANDFLTKFLHGTSTESFVGELQRLAADSTISVGSSRVDLQACKLEYSIVSPK